MQGHQVLLLLDNASPHEIPDGHQMSNVLVKFLPPNMTSRLQPLDAGIIRATKAYYKQSITKWIVSHLMSLANTGIVELSGQTGITIADAILWIKMAWAEIKQDTIVGSIHSY